MSDEKREHAPVTARIWALWATPPLLAIVAFAITFWQGWQPWFGYACLITGALGTLMLVGQHFRIGDQKFRIDE
ncbi:MAG: hypothetical protein AAFX09_07230 [Pseudomonadota bacterium]